MKRTTINKALAAAGLVFATVAGAAGADGKITLAEALIALAGAPIAGRIVWRIPYFRADVSRETSPTP